MVSGSQLLRLSARWTPFRAVRPFGRPVVLTFHGVSRHIEDHRIGVSQHTVDEFATLARSLKEFFDVLPLAALDEVANQPERFRRAVFLTSDDGYLNTLTNAADILDDLRLPWSLFVSTHHIESGEPNPLFLARLFAFFAPAGSYDIPHFPDRLELGGDRQSSASAIVRALKKLPVAEAKGSLAAMGAVFDESQWSELIARFPSERFLSWPDVAALAARGGEIGAHAHWHWPMNAHQTTTYADEQARISRGMVKTHVGRCDHFAYPFGNVGDISTEAWRAVRAAGFIRAFTTMSATVDAGTNAWLLPRYTLMPEERHLRSLLPLLRAGNRRLTKWQQRLSD
ncbi:MAG: polysaccharide deacetylase family protein [Rhizomicrobium sp.]